MLNDNLSDWRNIMIGVSVLGPLLFAFIYKSDLPLIIDCSTIDLYDSDAELCYSHSDRYRIRWLNG